MDRLGPADARNVQDALGRQVALSRWSWPDPVRLIGKARVERPLIGVRVHGNRLDPELGARSDHPDGDLGAVRDEQATQWRSAVGRHASDLPPQAYTDLDYRRAWPPARPRAVRQRPWSAPPRLPSRSSGPAMVMRDAPG